MLLERRGVLEGVQDGDHRADQPFSDLGGPVPRIRGLGLRRVDFGWVRVKISALLVVLLGTGDGQTEGRTDLALGTRRLDGGCRRSCRRSLRGGGASHPRVSFHALGASLSRRRVSGDCPSRVDESRPGDSRRAGNPTSVLPLLERVLDSGFVRGLGAFPNQVIAAAVEAEPLRGGTGRRSANRRAATRLAALVGFGLGLGPRLGPRRTILSRVLTRAHVRTARTRTPISGAVTSDAQPMRRALVRRVFAASRRSHPPKGVSLDVTTGAA